MPLEFSELKAHLHPDPGGHSLQLELQQQQREGRAWLQTPSRSTAVDHIPELQLVTGPKGGVSPEQGPHSDEILHPLPEEKAGILQTPQKLTEQLRQAIDAGDPEAVAKFTTRLKQLCEQMHDDKDVERFLSDLKPQMPDGLQLQERKFLPNAGNSPNPGFQISIGEQKPGEAGGKTTLVLQRPLHFDVGSSKSFVSIHGGPEKTYTYYSGHFQVFEPIRAMD